LNGTGQSPPSGLAQSVGWAAAPLCSTYGSARIVGGAPGGGNLAPVAPLPVDRGPSIPAGDRRGNGSGVVAQKSQVSRWGTIGGTGGTLLSPIRYRRGGIVADENPPVTPCLVCQRFPGESSPSGVGLRQVTTNSGRKLYIYPGGAPSSGVFVTLALPAVPAGHFRPLPFCFVAILFPGKSRAGGGRWPSLAVPEGLPLRGASARREGLGPTLQCFPGRFVSVRGWPTLDWCGRYREVASLGSTPNHTEAGVAVPGETGKGPLMC